jgi:hypothetical protein
MWSIFGRSDELISSPYGGITGVPSKKSSYENGAFCSECLEKDGMYHWVYDDLRCERCDSPPDKRVKI